MIVHHDPALRDLEHAHRFGTEVETAGERRTRWVVALTVTMMVAEITAGALFGSMALLADGWHMGTHAAALGVAAFAYWYARRHASDPRYTFGTGKVGDDVIEKLIRKHFDLRPYGITKMLDLEHPIYQATAAYGHFGRKPKEVSYVDGAGKKHTATAFSWEKTDKADELRKAAKL